ncbi:GAF domain-containing protein [Candidatus Uabimicrobium sp. HlEnr_7]|uniref:GAF domain-containing protein n=1 Tax=Candidatus Uabimicrobium helgolandensis TaxID=3095367 RepID=UPI0035588A13
MLETKNKERMHSLLFKKVTELKELLLSMPQKYIENFSIEEFLNSHLHKCDNFLGPLYPVNIEIPQDKWQGIERSPDALCYMQIILEIEQKIHYGCPIGALIDYILAEIAQKIPNISNISVWSIASSKELVVRGSIQSLSHSSKLNFPFRRFVLQKMFANENHVAWSYKKNKMKYCLPIKKEQAIIGAIYCEILRNKSEPYIMCLLHIVASLVTDIFFTPKKHVTPLPKVEKSKELETLEMPEIPQGTKEEFQQVITTYKFPEPKSLEEKVVEIPAKKKKKERKTKLIIPNRQLINNAIKNKSATLAEDAKGDYGDMSVSIVNQQIESTISAPIMEKDGDLQGLIYLENFNRRFKEDDLALVTAVASQLATFLKNVYDKKALENKADDEKNQLIKEMAVYLLERVDKSSSFEKNLQKIANEIEQQNFECTYFETIYKISCFLVASTKNPQKILENFTKQSTLSFPSFEKWLSDDAMRPGPIERLVAQSRKLKRWIQVTIGLKFIAVANAFDTLIEFFTSIIKTVFNSWKFAKSVQRRVQRQKSGQLVEEIAYEWQQNRVLLSRFFRFSGYIEEKNQPTFALELALDIRKNLDEFKQDLALLTTSQITQATKKSIKDFLVGLIPNPLDVLLSWKDLIVVVFFMKYNRGEIEQMYLNMTDSTVQVIEFLCEQEQKKVPTELQDYEQELKWRGEKLRTYKDLETCINSNRNHLQRLIQVIANSSKLITPRLWSTADIIREIKISRYTNKSNFLCDIELERRLIRKIKNTIKSDNDELQKQLQDNMIHRKRYKLAKKLADDFL